MPTSLPGTDEDNLSLLPQLARWCVEHRVKLLSVKPPAAGNGRRFFVIFSFHAIDVLGFLNLDP
jgi:hypothetical protein